LAGLPLALSGMDAPLNRERGKAMKREIVAALVAVAPLSCMTVQAGEVGVLWTTSGVNDTVYKEGLYTVSPLSKPSIYNRRSQEREEQLEVLAANGLRIVLESSIRYHIIPEETVALDRELGSNFYSILIGPVLRSQARRVVGRYQPEEIYSTRREIIEREIREGVEKAIDGRHVALEGVFIRNVTLPKAIEMAINNKLEAEQASLKMKYVIERTRQESEQRLIEEKTTAELQGIQAAADASAKVAMAKATDEANRLLQAHLTDPILQWQKTQALEDISRSANAKIIFTGDGRTPGSLIDLR
jgi:regulator of protease activity HflC (stomatin/prohibitin superfamily)